MQSLCERGLDNELRAGRRTRRTSRRGISRCGVPEPRPVRWTLAQQVEQLLGVECARRRCTQEVDGVDAEALQDPSTTSRMCSGRLSTPPRRSMVMGSRSKPNLVATTTSSRNGPSGAGTRPSARLFSAEWPLFADCPLFVEGVGALQPGHAVAAARPGRPWLTSGVAGLHQRITTPGGTEP